MEDYLAEPAVSSGSIADAMTSMAHYHALHVLRVEKKTTEALRIGTLCHTAILEGPIFREKFRVMAKVDGRTKEGREYRKDFEASLKPGDILVTEDECDMITGMIESILKHPIAAGLLTDGRAEVSGFITDKDTGLPLKIRPDFLRDDGIVIDYKTTRDASPKWFPRDAAKLGYHIKSAFYRMVTNEILGTPKNTTFAFIAQEKEPPYAVCVYVPDQAFMERGEQIVRHYLGKIAVCRKTDVWPGYSEQALSLALPEWAMKDDEEVVF